MFRRGDRMRPLRGSAATDTAIGVAGNHAALNALGGARLIELARHGSTASEFSVLG